MVDWKSQEVIDQNSVSFARCIHVVLGVYIWEWLISLDYDWYCVTKKKIRWPMITYLLNRYSLLLSLVGIAAALNIRNEVNCQALYTFNQVTGNAAVGLSSLNLSLRTMAVWSQDLYVVIPLVAIILGHWALLIRSVLIKSIWVEGAGCAIVDTDNKLLAAMYIYSMIFDFIVMSLTAWKLFIPFTPGRSRLVRLVFTDGLVYFVIAFLVNLLAMIFMLLNLNPVMSVIASVPAATASTIVACRVVRRLSRYNNTGVNELLPISVRGSSIGRPVNVGMQMKPHSKNVRFASRGVRVQVEHLCPQDRECDSIGDLVHEGTKELQSEGSTTLNSPGSVI